MKHSYLEEIGITEYPWNGWNQEYSKKVLKDFEKQREIYGFDSRECFDLDTTLLMILYERLKMFLKDSVSIDWNDKNSLVEYHGIRRTVPDIIKMILTAIENYFNLELNTDISLEEYTELQNKDLDDIFNLLRLIFKYLWW